MREIKIIRKFDYEKQFENALLLELDYELACLHEAMTNGDDTYKAKCIISLKEICSELERFRAYA